MERKIGEKFEYSPGVWLEVAPRHFACQGCYGKRSFFARCPGVCIGGGGVIFRLCDPPAPEKPETPKPSEATFEFSAKLEEIKAAPPPSEWMRGMTEAWQQEIIEAARDAFVCRFWDASNISLSHAMGISEATVRRIRKKRLRKNREQQ